MTRDSILRLRPADSLNLLFLVFLSGVCVIFDEKIAGSWRLTFSYAFLMLVQALLIRMKDRGGIVRLCYDLIFPTVSILFIFDSLESIVHSVNPRDIDALLIKLDYALFGGYPTVMMEKIMSPLLTDVMQLSYTSYYFMPLALGILLKIKKDDSRFDHSLFLIMLCFYLSYLGYMLMPALGPRYAMEHLHNAELTGYILTEPIQHFLNRLEGIKRDAFPSGHTAVALTVLYLSFKFEKTLYRILIPFVAALIFSTVYCRYHYGVDVIAGFVLTFATIILGERYHAYWSKRFHTGR